MIEHLEALQWRQFIPLTPEQHQQDTDEAFRRLFPDPTVRADMEALWGTGDEDEPAVQALRGRLSEMLGIIFSEQVAALKERRNT
jgi:hypothetical protein